VFSVGEAIDQEVIRNREMVRTVEHARAGAVKLLGSPLRFEDFDAPAYRASPLLGEHTRAVLAALGYSQAEIQQLIAAEVVGVPEHPRKK
jgi:crotonobetainyl-CoA:carnitine CoA-transferase CaiB-like acyl-CoA transferase